LQRADLNIAELKGRAAPDRRLPRHGQAPTRKRELLRDPDTRLALYQLAMMVWDIVTKTHEIMAHTGFFLPHPAAFYPDNGELRLPNEIDIPLITLGGGVDAAFLAALNDAVDLFGNLDRNPNAVATGHSVKDPNYPYYPTLRYHTDGSWEPWESRRPWAWPSQSPVQQGDNMPDTAKTTPTETYNPTESFGEGPDRAFKPLSPGPYPVGSMPDVFFRLDAPVDPPLRLPYEQCQTPWDTDQLNIAHLARPELQFSPIDDPIPFSAHLIAQLTNETGYSTQFNLDSHWAFAYLTWDWIRDDAVRPAVGILGLTYAPPKEPPANAPGWALGNNPLLLQYRDKPTLPEKDHDRLRRNCDGHRLELELHRADQRQQTQPPSPASRGPSGASQARGSAGGRAARPRKRERGPHRDDRRKERCRDEPCCDEFGPQESARWWSARGISRRMMTVDAMAVAAMAAVDSRGPAGPRGPAAAPAAGQPGGLNNGDINNPNPPGVFVGPRPQLDLPYLFMRANPADLGARPIVNAPFWESPDIYLLGGLDPGAAPPIPPALGQVAQAGAPNTIYAHVWNFGNAAANEVAVEFYWVNPSLGINASTLNLIAQTFTQIGARGSGDSHVVVGGHERLLVRVWDNPADLPGDPTFDAAWNRHVAQRSIHVQAPGMAAAIRRGDLIKLAAVPAMEQPLLINVGPLFGAPATVAVERAAPSMVPWLQLHTGQRGVFPAMAPPTGTASGFPTTGGAASQQVHGDDQNVACTTTDAAPGPGEAHAYRVTATQGDTVFGGYTIVLLG
jgi:hypothetical protein